MAATGGAVIEYDGIRGKSFTVRWLEDGRFVRERLGVAPEWNRRKAQAELRKRIVAAQNGEKRRRVAAGEPVTFARFVDGWADAHCDARTLKKSTRSAYRTIVTVHLEPAFGRLPLDQITRRKIEEYLDAKRKDEVAATTLHRHLACLSLIFRAALRDDLVVANPVGAADRPKAIRRKWRILTPVEIGAVAAAFTELAGEADNEAERLWRVQCRVIFMVLVDTGMRRGELQGLRWRSVRLADPSGPRLEVVETCTRNAVETPKSEAGVRTITLNEPIDAELFDHRGRTPFSGEDERVFCSSLGTPFDAVRYTDTFRLALKKVGVADYVRPFHDMRHTSLTNGAAAGMNDKALQRRAGHASPATTALYINLSGVEFAAEDAKLGARLWGVRDRV